MKATDYRELVNKELPNLNIFRMSPRIATPELLKMVAVQLFLQRSNNEILTNATRENLLALELPEATHNFE